MMQVVLHEVIDTGTGEQIGPGSYFNPKLAEDLAEQYNRETRELSGFAPGETVHPNSERLVRSFAAARKITVTWAY